MSNRSFDPPTVTAKTVVIFRNDFDEFEVPTDSPSQPASSFDAGLYLTDDKQDARDTAIAAWQKDFDLVVVKFRRGTYQAHCVEFSDHVPVLNESRETVCKICGELLDCA